MQNSWDMTASGLVELYTHFGGMYYVLSTSGSKRKQQGNFYQFTNHHIPEQRDLLTVLPRDLEISYIEMCIEDDCLKQNSSETNKENS
jgi:hypothetical protein